MINEFAAPVSASVLLQAFTFILLLLVVSLRPGCSCCRTARPGTARLGSCRFGSARPTDTMTYILRPEAAAAAGLTSVSAVSIISTTSGSISFTHWSNGFSYLSVKSAAFVPIFPSVLLLRLSFVGAVLPPALFFLSGWSISRNRTCFPLKRL